MQRKRILVINPNSNETVTEGLRHSLVSFADDAEIDCCTLPDGPFGIESDEDIETVKPLIVDRIERSPEYDAYVIACYSDPGLEECRERFDSPVFGMQQSAVETATRGGKRFGVVALSDESIRRHITRIETLGFSNQLAGELPLDVTVDEAANDPDTLAKVITQGRRLIDELGAESLVLGCAGMAALRRSIEDALGVPVIEPAQAAVRQAVDSTAHTSGEILGDESAVFIDVYSPSTRWVLDVFDDPAVRRVEARGQTTVVHNQHDDYDVYIGRAVPEHGLEGSKWGNPFVMADDSEPERERAIAEYRGWIVTQPELMSSLGDLRGLRLGCWCAPKRCHGDILVELVERLA